MDYTTLMKMELLRMKHARALTTMRVAAASMESAACPDRQDDAYTALRRFEADAKQAEADLEKLIAESQPVTKS